MTKENKPKTDWYAVFWATMCIVVVPTFLILWLLALVVGSIIGAFH